MPIPVQDIRVTVPGYTYIGQVHHFAYTIIVIVPSYTYTGVNILENLIWEKKYEKGGREKR